MNWLYLLTGISLLAFTTAEDVKACPPPAKSLTIQKIARKAGEKLDVCCDEVSQVILAPKILLAITQSDGKLELRDSATKAHGCVEFDIDITTVAIPADDIKFAMQLLDKDECPTAGGEVQIKYPSLPAVTSFAAEDPVNPEDKILLLQGKMNGFALSNAASMQHVSSSDGQTNYYFGTLPNELQLCRDLTTVNFCDEPMTYGSGSLEQGPSVTSSVLSYGNTVTATVTMETTSSITTDGSDTLDILYMSNIAGDRVLCQGSLTGSCDISWPNPSSDTATFRLIGLKSDTPIESESHSIPDRELLAGEISPGIIEARWLILSDVDKNYHLTLSEESQTIKEDQELNVDCSEVSLINCFGYFTGLTQATTYKVTVQTQISETTQIKSSAITTTVKVFKELQIQDIQISGHLGDKAVLVEVCFSHASYDVDKLFSHYEFVLINEEGRWLKHYLTIQETDGDLCFSPYTINPETFDISQGTTLVVTQRAENGFSVLASGKAHVSFNTNL